MTRPLSALLCNRRFHPKGLTRAAGIPYWFFCRLSDGHTGDCDSIAVHEVLAKVLNL